VDSNVDSKNDAHIDSNVVYRYDGNIDNRVDSNVDSNSDCHIDRRVDSTGDSENDCNTHIVFRDDIIVSRVDRLTVSLTLRLT
jgi:hypothetical protein